MALEPLNAAHALQIQAGLLGRKAGHKFEDSIASEINSSPFPLTIPKSDGIGHVFKGRPSALLLSYIGRSLGFEEIIEAVAISTGSLATSEEGQKWLMVNGVRVSKCKSDLVITIRSACGTSKSVGVSTKQCNNASPTNAQLFFSTARGFSNLLKANAIPVSDEAVLALRQFCGDVGFRPMDSSSTAVRLTDPRRFFWEEVNGVGRAEWEALFSGKQDEITRLLLQKAYMDDPFSPDFLLHKTRLEASPDEIEVAIYSIDELVRLSRSYKGFETRAYSVRKGSYKDPAGVQHLAPRFGIIQMQRGGQEQHPEQLQFNLEAGYFYKLDQIIQEPGNLI